MNTIAGCIRMHTTMTRGLAWTVGLAFVLAGCGGGSGSTGGGVTSPSPTPPPMGSGTTITIANNTVSPQSVTITRGNRVTFVNNDTRSHEIASNPHPEHTDCPEINQVGLVSPGQSRETGALNNARTCGYHDHLQDSVRALQGTITIQ